MERWRAHESRFHPARKSRTFTAAGAVPEQAFGRPPSPIVVSSIDAELSILERELAERATEERPLPFPEAFALEPEARRMLYRLTRLVAPATVIETGVANGVSSWFFLRAFAANGRGTLYSIDYPILDRRMRDRIGCLVPPNDREAWKLLLGDSGRILRSFRGQGLAADMFLHDSEHSYALMRRELAGAWSLVRDGGLILCDDIDANSAFEEFAAALPDGTSIVRSGRMGIVRKPARIPSAVMSTP